MKSQSTPRKHAKEMEAQRWNACYKSLFNETLSLFKCKCKPFTKTTKLDLRFIYVRDKLHEQTRTFTSMYLKMRWKRVWFLLQYCSAKYSSAYGNTELWCKSCWGIAAYLHDIDSNAKLSQEFWCHFPYSALWVLLDTLIKSECLTLAAMKCINAVKFRQQKFVFEYFMQKPSKSIYLSPDFSTYKHFPFIFTRNIWLYSTQFSLNTQFYFCRSCFLFVLFYVNQRD